MKRFMLVTTYEGEEKAIFSDDRSKLDQYKMDLECGLGGYGEIYERTTDEDGCESYTLLYA